MTGLMAKPVEFFRQFAHALARPTQRRLGIAPSDGIHQTFQIRLQRGVFVDGSLAASTRAAYSAPLHTWGFVEFLDSPDNRPPRYTGLARHLGCSSKTDRQTLTRGDKPPHALVEKRR